MIHDLKQTTSQHVNFLTFKLATKSGGIMFQVTANPTQACIRVKEFITSWEIIFQGILEVM